MGAERTAVSQKLFLVHRVFSFRITTLLARWEVAALCKARIQQVSLQGCGVYFLVNCGECPFRVGWASFTKKFRNVCLCPRAGFTFLEAVTRRIGAFWGCTELLLGVLRASAACRFALGNFAA